MFKSFGFLFVLFALVFSGFRWRWPKFLSRSRDPQGKRAEAARIRKECLERKRLERQISLELKSKK